jgi:ribosomal protein S26
MEMCRFFVFSVSVVSIERNRERKSWRHFKRVKIGVYAQCAIFILLCCWQDSKWLGISMVTIYENLCDNCVGGVELTFVWHFINVHLIFFIPLYIDLTIFKIARLWTVKEMSTLTYPHSCHIHFRIVAIRIHNHFESPNILTDVTKLTTTPIDMVNFTVK